MELMDAALNIIGVTVVDAVAMFLWIAWLMKKDLYAERKGNAPSVMVIGASKGSAARLESGCRTVGVLLYGFRLMCSR
jgi:hypothetical protein